MEAILQWDGQALLFIQEHIRQVWMDGFWKTITHLGDAGSVAVRGVSAYGAQGPAAAARR